MTTRYFSPAGLGASGPGLVKENPIYGLSDLSMVNAGDTIVLLPGHYYENLIVPVNDLIIIGGDSEDQVVFDATADISGDLTYNSSYQTVSNAPWVLANPALNIWKKGTIQSNLTFLDNQLLTIMETTNVTNSVATIEAAIQEYEVTFRTETLNGVTTTMYLRLPIGETPNGRSIRRAARIGPVDYYGGLIEAVGKENIAFKGALSVFASSPPNGSIRGVYLENIIGFRQEAPVYSKYCGHAFNIIGGDDVVASVIATKGSGGAAFRIAAYSPKTSTAYSAGTITIKDSLASRCGTLSVMSGGILVFGDMDGLAGIGYDGGPGTKIHHVIVEDSKSFQCGPQFTARPSYRSLEGARGSSIFVGTGTEFELENITIRRCLSEEDFFRAYDVRSQFNSKVSGTISIHDNIIKNNWRLPATEFTNNCGPIYTYLAGTNQGPINWNVHNNLITGGNHSVASIAPYFITAASAASNVYITNNIIQNNEFEASFGSANAGFFRLGGTALTGDKVINGNICYSESTIYGKDINTSYADFTAWQAAGHDLQGQNGTIIVNEDNTLVDGTATCLEVGIKYWGNKARPTAYNGEPRPDVHLDAGPYQSLSHPFHPANM